MGRRSLILLLAVLTACHAAPEGRLAVDPELEGEILASDRIHSPLPLHPERSYETVRAAETVLEEEALPDELEIRFANHASVRPVGPPDDIDYATFGSYSARLQLNGRNLEEWNRIAFTVTPDAGGAQVTSMTVSFQAAPGGPKPGFNEPSGSHYIPLQDGVANPCYLEIGEFRRDRMRNITFAVADRGQSPADSSIYRITDIRLQRVATDAPMKPLCNRFFICVLIVPEQFLGSCQILLHLNSFRSLLHNDIPDLLRQFCQSLLFGFDFLQPLRLILQLSSGFLKRNDTFFQFLLAFFQFLFLLFQSFLILFQFLYRFRALFSVFIFLFFPIDLIQEAL